MGPPLSAADPPPKARPASFKDRFPTGHGCLGSQPYGKPEGSGANNEKRGCAAAELGGFCSFSEAAKLPRSAFLSERSERQRIENIGDRPEALLWVPPCGLFVQVRRACKEPLKTPLNSHKTGSNTHENSNISALCKIFFTLNLCLACHGTYCLHSFRDDSAIEGKALNRRLASSREAKR